MPQHDLVINNASGAAVRADLNDALAALGSTMKGPNAPSAPIAGMLWLDDDTPSATVWTLKLYDGADWLSLGTFNVSTNTFTPANALPLSGGALTGALLADGNGQNLQLNGRTGDDLVQLFFRNFSGANNLASITSDSGAALRFGTGSQTAPTVPTERMRLNATGMGIGLTSYSLPLGVVADGNGQNLQLNGRTGDDLVQLFFRNFSGANNLASITSGSTGALIFGAGSQTAPTVPTERMRIVGASGNVGIGTASPGSLLTVNGDLAFNSGYGSAAVAYGVRAWASVTIAAGVPTMDANGNFTSITDNGVGDFTFNFSNNMPNTHYAIAGSAVGLTNAAGVQPGLAVDTANGQPLLKSTSQVRIGLYRLDANAYADAATFSIMVVR